MRCSAQSSPNSSAPSRAWAWLITQAQAVSDVAGVFAALAILGALGIALHSSVRRLEHRIVHWAHRGKR